jgi:4,5-dihydroxyphthalate decarboxylase
MVRISDGLTRQPLRTLNPGGKLLSRLPLTLACWDYDRTRPLIDGRVQPQDIELDIIVSPPKETFPRMLDRQEFQVSELALASYVALKASGDCPFVAIPVPLSRMFRHSSIWVRTDAGIRVPPDLKGRRVGTSQYGSTSNVFIRGLLQHEYGVFPQDVHWFLGGLTTPRVPFSPNLPPDLRLDKLEHQSMERMLEEGQLDAMQAVDIPPSFARGAPHIARLFPNYKEVEQDYYRRTGIFPIMHVVVIREDVYREHRWVAASLYQAFCEARDIAVEGLYDTDALRLALPWLIDHIEEARQVFGKDFWSYGLEPNRATYTAIGQYVYEQGLAPRAVSPDELFAPGLA